MKWIFFCLLTLAWSGANCQLSPTPYITSFAGSSLPSPHSGPDSAFCKGGELTIEGGDFLSTNGGEFFDSVSAWLGNVRANIINVAVGDTLTVGLPDSFPNDTTLTLTVIKHTQFGSQSYQYGASSTVRLLGDHAVIDYPPGPFCLGGPNPVPSVELGGGTSGGFCCWQGGGFSVSATGEIPLHSGALGSHTFLWAGTHPVCADTQSFTVQIDSMVQATAFVGGSTNLVVCENTSVLMADSVGLFPTGGLFDSPSGLALLDDSLGLFDIGASAPGTHVLTYTAEGCVDTAIVTIEIEEADSAVILFPNSGPAFCPAAGTASPLFLSGTAGGAWLSTPPGLVTGGGGVIDLQASQPGAYVVEYIPPGSCADTALVASSLVIGVSDTAGFSIPQSLCAGDSLFADSILNGGGSSFALRNGSNTVMALVQGNGAPRQFIAANLAPGGHTLTQSTGGDCPDTLVRSFVVLAVEDPSFSYPPGNLFCLQDANPYPVVSGTTGGLFSSMSANTVLGTGGMLDLSASGPGIHRIEYATPGPCPDRDTVSVTILSSPDATFSYPASQFCTSEPDPSPSVATQGGTFSSSPGLVLDSATGAIDLDQSQPGAYAVTHTLSGGCASFFTLNLTISDTGTAAALAYPSPLCAGSPPAFPILSGDTAGTYSASAGLVFSPFRPGAVDLAATPPGSYAVWFTPDNGCSAPASDTLTVIAPLDPSFSYDTTVFCMGTGHAAPSLVANPGIFTTSNGLAIDSLDGTIEFDSSILGFCTVFHTSPGPCPATDSVSIHILQQPNSYILIDPGDWFCEGNPATVSVNSPGGVNFAFFHNGLPADADFDSYSSADFQNGDTVTTVTWNALGCSDTIDTVVHVLPRPDVILLQADTIATGDARVNLSLMATEDGAEITLETVAWNDVRVTPPSRKLGDMDAGEVWNTSLSLWTHELVDPAWVWALVHVEAGSCAGDTDSIRIWVTPETDIWIAEVITPNGDGVNDTWKMLIPGISDSMDYELSVFNRAGGKVAALIPPDQDWDGGGLPDGVYWWALRDRRNGRELQTGGLTIRRK